METVGHAPDNITLKRRKEGKGFGWPQQPDTRETQKTGRFIAATTPPHRMFSMKWQVI
jgi:hypothetical protein